MSDYKALIEKFPFCDPAKRHDFVMFFDVRGGNPNGDPDAGNLPRMDPTTRRGIVTDVCTKRKIRDYLSNHLGRNIFIQSEAALNTLYFRSARAVPAAKELLAELKATEDAAFLSALDADDAELHEWLGKLDVEGLEYNAVTKEVSYMGEARKKKPLHDLLLGDEPPVLRLKDKLGKVAEKLADQMKGSKAEKPVRDAIKNQMAKDYDDIRLFGAVLTAGTNAGQVRGPVQITFGRSIEPILPQEAAITRCAITKDSDRARKQTEFGRKAWLNYAIYRQHGHFSPAFAKQTFLDASDLLRFWIAVCKCHDAHRSASSGEQGMQELVVFTHTSPRGNAPSHKLLDPIQVQRASNDEPIGVFDIDYKIVVRTGREENQLKSLGDHQLPGVTPHQPLSQLAGLEEALGELSKTSTATGE